MAQIFKTETELPENFSHFCSPKFKPQFKSKPEVIKDPEFNTRLQSRVAEWRYVKELGVDTMVWWEHMVKPHIKKLLIDRGKEMKQERICALNLLMLRQAYLVRKLQSGELDKLGELKLV